MNFYLKNFIIAYSILAIFPKQIFAGTFERPFVVIVMAQDHSDSIEKNLQSIFQQKYENYIVFCVTNGSTDKTNKKAKRIVKELEQRSRTIFIKTYKQYTQQEIIQRILRSGNEDIKALIMGAGESLQDEYVLSSLNEEPPKNWDKNYANEVCKSQYSSAKECFTILSLINNFQIPSKITYLVYS